MSIVNMMLGLQGLPDGGLDDGLNDLFLWCTVFDELERSCSQGIACLFVGLTSQGVRVLVEAMSRS